MVCWTQYSLIDCYRWYTAYSGAQLLIIDVITVAAAVRLGRREVVVALSPDFIRYVEVPRPDVNLRLEGRKERLRRKIDDR